MKKHRFNIFPKMLPDDYARVKADIVQHGYRADMPIMLYEGEIIDGWNRYLICQELGVQPTFEIFEGTSSEAAEYTMRTNKRRSLTSSQWAAIAVEAKDVIEALAAEAKARQGTRNDLNFVQQIAQSGDKEKNKTRTKLANMFSTNRQYISDAQRLRAEAPEQFEAVRAGTKSITEVKKDLQKQELYGCGDIDDEWYTPKWLFEALGVDFDLDVCSPANRLNTSVPARDFYTIDDDGLKQPWHGLVWCNPPYGDAAPWAARMIEHNNGLFLSHIPMNAKWCCEVWNACTGIRLFQGIEFVRPSGKLQRPAFWLQLAAFGSIALEALDRLVVPDDIAVNPRKVPSPMWVRYND